jgi:hypothetical protein
LWLPFPGFEVTFDSEFSPDPVWSSTVDPAELHESSLQKDEHLRSYSAVNLYLNEFEKIRKLDDKIDVAICVVRMKYSRIVVRNLISRVRLGSASQRKKKIDAARGRQVCLKNTTSNSIDFRRTFAGNLRPELWAKTFPSDNSRIHSSD